MVDSPARLAALAALAVLLGSADVTAIVSPLPWLVPLTALGIVILQFTARPLSPGGAIRLLARPPVGWFTSYAILGGLFAFWSIRPAASVLHAALYLVVAAAMALTAAGTRPTALLGVIEGACALPIWLSFLLPHDASLARFAGVYENPNPLSFTSALLVLLVLCMRGARSQREAPRRTLLIDLAVLLPALAAIYRTGSLTAPLSASAVLAVVIARLWKAGGRTRALIVRSGVPIGAAALFTVTLLNVSGRFAPYVVDHGSAVLTDLSSATMVHSRIVLWQSGLQWVRLHPWHGYGLGSTSRVTAPLRAEWTKAGMHNALLEAAICLGIPGAALIVAFYASMLRRSLRPAADPASQAFGAIGLYAMLCSMTEPVVLGWPRLGMFLVLLAAATATAEHSSRRVSAAA